MFHKLICKDETGTVEVKGTTRETGCYVDGHWGNYGLSRMLTVTDGILGTHFYDDAAKEWALTQDGDAVDENAWDGFTFEFLHEIADDAEEALNDATPNGFGWGWHDGEFFLSADKTGFMAQVGSVGGYVMSMDPSAILNWDGETFYADTIRAMFRIEFLELDEDGDETGTTYNVWGAWSGGMYVDLCTEFGDASDIASNVSGFYYGNAVEVVNLGDRPTDEDGRPNAPYTSEMAFDAMCGWAEGYVNPEDGESSVEHDFGHYGFTMVSRR